MAIAEYVEFMAGGGRGPGGDELRRRARDSLLSSGWTLYKKAKCDGRQELRYQAPHGASYISLIVACKKFQQFSTAPPRSRTSGKPGMKRKSAAPDCSSRKSKEINAENGGRETGFGGGEDERGPAVRNPFSRECCLAKHRKMRRVSALYADDALEKYAARKRKKASSAPPQLCAASPAASLVRVLRPRTKDGDKAQAAAAAAAAACQPTRSRTIIAVLMDKKIVPPTAKLSYKRTRDEPPVKQGTLTAQGTIRCACGCGRKSFTVAEFAAHALGGECGAERPSASVYLNDGRSLSQCLVQLMRAHGGGGNKTMGSPSPRARLKRKCPPELEGGDFVCSVCADFGDVLLCDCCPSTFHHGCVGLDATPQGEWFCPSCRCAVCGSSEFDLDADGEFTDKTAIYCDQCEREYHAGCIRSRGDRLECCPEGPWLCSHDCSNVFQRLQGLVGRSIPTSVEGLTFIVLRSTKLPEEEAMAAEEHGKLCAAFDVLHECFVTLIEPQTGTDLSHDIVFNRESELRRLNFRGFYVVGLEKGGELITVGTLRVYGKKVAELPLVGTRFAHRRQGMCRLLINQLENLLGELGVERLVLPAVPELLQTWTGSFGFQAMSHSDKMEIAEHTVMCFQGTTMCQKFITAAAAP
ncbi:increased DNA methylation 1-like [Hordeum vulgare subsp. vulgare]|uniref:PHD-type domain-containing protein n=1 Tax=Hordeum vulgare subsp. vulgare TaxID=112509 RepID=A0A8I7B245_HORVV|nr:increased DNA methylation 1-like [Hordeum vulgare subsp. vulgare]